MSKSKYILFEKALEINNLGGFIREYKFHSTRRWRIDYAWPKEKLAVEIEGGIWIQGRHTRGSGFVKDMEKYNALTMAGFKLLRFTPKQIEDGTALNLIERFILDLNRNE